MTSRSILIIDDDRALLSALSTLLREQGHRVTAAADGTEAALAIETGSFDLVLTDVLFPGKHRIEAVMELLRSRGIKRIIAMSGGGQYLPEYYLRLMRSFGAKAILAKPFENKELLAKIEELCSS